MRNSLPIIFIIMTLACAPLLLPSVSTPVPTLAPGEIEVIIAQTAARAASQTAILISPTLTPTLTPSPTVTASLTPSPTATFIFLLPTLTGSPSGTGINGPLNQGFSCKIISNDPPLNAVLPAGKSFNAHWIVLNDGTELWDGANMDYSYASGQKMYIGDKVRDLNESIASGEILDIVIEMKAPKASGVYTIVWKLHSGREYFCPMTIRISV
ncbi:MAG: NBR1-Ig-like domain-containing protein [Anaerolineales bacterium]|nr:NBR1-Ig-like domain-containing protein [Anaerolineales bacterium]